MKDSKILKAVINKSGAQNRRIKSDYPFFKNGLLSDLIFNNQVPNVQDTEELVNERGEFSFYDFEKLSPKERFSVLAWRKQTTVWENDIWFFLRARKIERMEKPRMRQILKLNKMKSPYWAKIKEELDVDAWY